MDIEVGWVFTCDGALWLWQTRSRRDRVLHVTVIFGVAKVQANEPGALLITYTTLLKHMVKIRR